MEGTRGMNGAQDKPGSLSTFNDHRAAFTSALQRALQDSPGDVTAILCAAGVAYGTVCGLLTARPSNPADTLAPALGAVRAGHKEAITFRRKAPRA